MPIEQVGFFPELHDVELDPSSHRDVLRPVARPDVERIVAYLEAGVGLAGVG